MARNAGMPRPGKMVVDPIELKGPPLEPGQTQGQAENPLPTKTEPDFTSLAAFAGQPAQPAAAQAAPQSAPPSVSDIFRDPEKLKALLTPFQSAQGQAQLPQPQLPQGPDPQLMRDTLQRANMLGMVHGALGMHLPSTYEVMKSGSAAPTLPPSPSYDAAKRNIELPLEMEQARVGRANKQAGVQNAYEQEKAKLGVQLGIHGSSQMAGLLGRYLGVEAGREAQARQFAHADQSQQRAFGQAERMFGEKTVAGQNKGPESHEINAGRLATNALNAANQMEGMLDQDKSTWDKGLQAKVPFTHYTIGTDAAKKFSTLQGAMISQLTQSDEVRRTTGNINDALGQTVVNAGDTYQLAKWKLGLFRQMMDTIHKTIASNHPTWATQPGHDDYAKYVTPKMIEEALKMPQQRAREFLQTAKSLTPAEQPFDPDAFLKE